MPAAARFAPPTTAAATAASVRRNRPTPPRSAPGCATAGWTSASCSASTAPSTRAPNRSAGRATAMARRTIEVDYLARVEGEGGVKLVIDGNTLKTVELRIFEPPRFFEAFLR